MTRLDTIVQEQRQLHEQATEILERSAEGMSAEDEQEHDRVTARWDELEAQRQRELAHEQRAELLEQASESRARQLMAEEQAANRQDDDEEQRSARVAAFERYVRSGERGLTAEDREMLTRAQGTSPDTAGGYVIDALANQPIEEAMLAFGGLLGAGVTTMTTATGATLPWPTNDDTGNQGYIIGENVGDTDSNITFGRVTFNAYTYSSGIFKAPVEFVQDSAISVSDFVLGKGGERIARRVAVDLATGDGASKPRGITVAAPVGQTTTANNAVTYDELLDWQHSVDPAYRMRGRFVFHDTLLKVIRKLKDSDGRPIWLPQSSGSAQDGAPGSMLGQPYFIDNSFPAFAADTVVGVYGDLSKYVVRRVRGTSVITFNERFGENRQIGWSVFERLDADLVDAGTGPIKSLKMAA